MSKPYDEYITRVLDDLPVYDVDIDTRIYEILAPNLRSLLADAWLDGTKYSLVTIESERRRRDDLDAQ